MNAELDDDLLMQELGLAARKVELVKLEGRVFLRLHGVVHGAGLALPYALVPERGVLAKPSKWRKLEREERAALLLQRASPDAAQALFLGVLDELETSEPAEYVFERIRQRVEHAIEREQEERHAARTKESINLAEYPESFDVASRMPRKFIALLGPTNSGKTHRAMEALAKAASGVYLAPLRLLALENYERLQAARPHGKELKVSLVTGEERRIAEGAPTSPAPSKCSTRKRSKWP
jgi:ATP-dependent RNA helicase SUPV3L1/SUV3